MALNNSQYDEIFRSYDAKQLKAQHQLEERTKAAYERSPELKALDASIAEISVASARRLLDGDSSALTELKAELKNLRTRKKALMKELSLPENYFEPVYECPDCKDTGYIDGKPCHCFKQQKQHHGRHISAKFVIAFHRRLFAPLFSDFSVAHRLPGQCKVPQQRPTSCQDRCRL